MNNNWSIFKKFSFLFFTYYVVLFCTMMQSFTSFLVMPIWSWLVPQFCTLIGEDRVRFFIPSMSGDTLFNWYMSLLFVVIAFILSSLILLIDRERKNYSNLLPWTTLLLRYYMFEQMILYGLAKLFTSQFPLPSLNQLESTFGDSSPMGLMWTFMGYSPAYSMFTGLLEFIGGLFLLSRKTTTLGSLIVFGVIINVFILNLCYDVPVKLYSGHLVLFSLILIILDGKRVMDFFMNRQSITPYVLPDITPSKWLKQKTILKWLVIVGIIGYYTYGSWKVYDTTRKPSAEKLELLKKYPLMNRKFHWVQEIPYKPMH